MAYGRYYLVQTKAPDGKDKLSQPAAVTVSASSHLTAQDGWQDACGMTVDNTVNLVNREETLPEDGGRERGVWWRPWGGGAVGGDLELLFSKQKKKKNKVMILREEKIIEN